MISRGSYFDKSQNRTRHKFVCPIKSSRKLAKKLGWVCPWNHPNFFKNKLGCTVNLRIDKDIRQKITYGSQSFKKLFKLRSAIERTFSRLLSICMQQSNVYGLQSFSNICTIAHITVLSIALLAVSTGNSDKSRFIKKFFQKA